MTSRARSRRRGRVRALVLEHVEAAPDGRERVAQLVRQHREELVLPPVGLASASSARLRSVTSCPYTFTSAPTGT